MEIQVAVENDEIYISKIYEQARNFFKTIDNPQWQDGYPQRDVIFDDIKNKRLLKVVDNNKIVGVATIFVDKEPYYETIYNGNWNGNGAYCVVHRVAIADEYKGKGVAGLLFDFAEKTAETLNAVSVRIDTHEKNKPMLRFLKNRGFEICGTVKLPSGDDRLALEKNFF